ncbi:MAG TPA: SPOR domain-containing protein, partial [Gemmatimonadaceae bacterium]|nr:SPOR domain-containing protein [Gemmatimonadaceae bacterium]
LALLCGACSDKNEAPESITPAARESRGTDHLLLRVPRAGGTGRVNVFPNLDSTVWVVDEVPGLARILAFDHQLGTIAFVDAKGLPGRIDLRETDVRTASRAKLTSLSSANGTDIFGVTAKGSVTRLNPVAVDWNFEPPVPARGVFAQPNGDLIVAADKGAQTILWKLRPPTEAVDDSTVLPLSGRGVSTQVGDRVYFTVDSGLVGVKARDLSPVGAVKFASTVTALAPTPSGDRLYVATSEREIAVVDRYSEQITARIPIPTAPSELRMDALGRYLIARFPASDSVWVIATGTNTLIGAVATEWETDLPALTPDGNIALLGPKDVTFVDPLTLEKKKTVANGAKDFWYFFAWDGFRPRARGIDDPVTFANDSTFEDSLSRAAAPPGSDTTARPRPVGPDVSPSAPRQSAERYSVSFAALLSEEKARELSTRISVDGVPAHVVATNTAGSPIYRVIMGPYPTREEAEKVGRASRRDYWVYEGAP